jgi:hypothetical protein
MERLRSQISAEFGTEINPIHIWLNVLSLCIFPVVAKPLIREIFQFPEEVYQHLMEERKTVVPQFITQALKAYENTDQAK